MSDTEKNDTTDSKSAPSKASSAASQMSGTTKAYIGLGAVSLLVVGFVLINMFGGHSRGDATGLRVAAPTSAPSASSSATGDTTNPNHGCSESTDKTIDLSSCDLGPKDISFKGGLLKFKDCSGAERIIDATACKTSEVSIDQESGMFRFKGDCARIAK